MSWRFVHTARAQSRVTFPTFQNVFNRFETYRDSKPNPDNLTISPNRAFLFRGTSGSESHLRNFSAKACRFFEV